MAKVPCIMRVSAILKSKMFHVKHFSSKFKAVMFLRSELFHVKHFIKKFAQCVI